MGALYSSEKGFNFEVLKYPTLPEAPYLTFNSAMLFLSSSILVGNVHSCFKNFKELPPKVPLKFFSNQKRFIFNLNKKSIFLLPLVGVWGIGQTILLAANTHIIPYPIRLSQENKQRVDDLMGNFIYYGLFLSQISLLQNNLRLIFPDSIGSTWFKSMYVGITGGGAIGYAIVGYQFYKIILDQVALNKAETMFSQ